MYTIRHLIDIKMASSHRTVRTGVVDPHVVLHCGTVLQMTPKADNRLALSGGG